MIETYVKDGGSLLVLLHIAPPLARLTERFGMILSNFVISESVNTIDGQSQDFYTSKILPHPITKGVKFVALYGTWAIMAETNARIIASTISLEIALTALLRPDLPSVQTATLSLSAQCSYN